MKVSIVIPCRNEEHYIGKCLQSIIDSDYHKNLLEVFVADGLSKDNSRNIIEQFSEKYNWINMLGFHVLTLRPKHICIKSPFSWFRMHL